MCVLSGPDQSDFLCFQGHSSHPSSLYGVPPASPIPHQHAVRPPHPYELHPWREIRPLQTNLWDIIYTRIIYFFMWYFLFLRLKSKRLPTFLFQPRLSGP